MNDKKLSGSSDYDGLGFSDIQKKSLDAVDEMFDNITDEEFLAAYLPGETGVGPTVSEYLQFHKPGFTTMIYKTGKEILDEYNNLLVAKIRNDQSPEPEVMELIPLDDLIDSALELAEIESHLEMKEACAEAINQLPDNATLVQAHKAVMKCKIK